MNYEIKRNFPKKKKKFKKKKKKVNICKVEIVSRPLNFSSKQRKILSRNSIFVDSLCKERLLLYV